MNCSFLGLNSDPFDVEDREEISEVEDEIFNKEDREDEDDDEDEDDEDEDDEDEEDEDEDEEDEDDEDDEDEDDEGEDDEDEDDEDEEDEDEDDEDDEDEDEDEDEDKGGFFKNLFSFGSSSKDLDDEDEEEEDDKESDEKEDDEDKGGFFKNLFSFGGSSKDLDEENLDEDENYEEEYEEEEEVVREKRQDFYEEAPSEVLDDSQPEEEVFKQQPSQVPPTPKLFIPKKPQAPPKPPVNLPQKEVLPEPLSQDNQEGNYTDSPMQDSVEMEDFAEPQPAYPEQPEMQKDSLVVEMLKRIKGSKRIQAGLALLFICIILILRSLKSRRERDFDYTANNIPK